MAMTTQAKDGETLLSGDIVCFAQPMDEYEETALLVIVECRDTRILVSDQKDTFASHKPGYIVPTRAILASDVLKVA